MFTTKVSSEFTIHRVALNSIQKRYNVKEQLSRYHEPDKFKKHMLAACEPYYKPKFQLPSETCKSYATAIHELHPLEKIFGDELTQRINQTNAILFIQHNFCKFEDERVYKNRITKLGGVFHPLNNRIYKYAFQKLGREEVLPLFVATKNALITGDAECLPDLINALLKMPEYVVLAGSIDGYLVKYGTLQAISKNKDVTTACLNLSLSLNLPGNTLTRLMSEVKDPGN